MAVEDVATRSRTGPRGPVIALVCSSGGLDALRRVLGRLPGDLGAVVVVLRHQTPTTRSHLAEILAASCALTVREAGDGDPLLPGVVLVVPPGTHALATTDDTLVLIASDGAPPYRPSADLLLTSLAVAAGPRAVAVVLSGMGRDGATGAGAVHRLGGTVLAADRASSAYFGMAEAAIEREEVVDRVLPVDLIAAALVDLVAADVARPAVDVGRPG
jgi:two-component system chemotaxis response regulator CheB